MMTMINNAFVKMAVIVTLLLTSNVTGFQVSGRSDNTHRRALALNPICKSKTVSSTKLHMDATLIPLLIGATGLIFAVFSFDNKIDLTDAGMAKAKSIRYNARKEKGEIPSKEAVANMDPYRWFAEEDEEVDMLVPKKKKGGGCG